MDDNQLQADYWSSNSGLKWITFENELDVVFESVNEELIKRARPKPGENILDIGCGTGATSRAFSHHLAIGGSITSLDISAPLLKHAEVRAKEAAIKVRCCLLDAQRDAIPGAPFDIATSRFGVMFFSDPVSAFDNLRKHLKTGGRLVVAAWAPINGNPWFQVPRDAAASRLGPPDIASPNAPGPLGFQDLDYTIGVLQRAGFHNASGEVADVIFRHPGPIEQVAALAANIGPAARILKKYQGGEDDIAAIREKVLDEFRVFETIDGICIPARLNFFEASRNV